MVFDTSGNGLINFSEFHAGVQNYLQRRLKSSETEELFKRFDQDQNTRGWSVERAELDIEEFVDGKKSLPRAVFLIVSSINICVSRGLQL